MSTPTGEVQFSLQACLFRVLREGDDITVGAAFLVKNAQAGPAPTW